MNGSPKGCGPNGECLGPDLCPLSQVRPGAAVRIRQLAGPPEICQRLREMGLMEDQRVKVVNRTSHFICQVCNARLGLSPSLAHTIWVEPLNPEPASPDMAEALQPLSQLPAGASGIVRQIQVPPEHRGRLLEMGVLTGTPIEVVRFAPLGDPIEVKVRGYHLSLRKHEAEQILVEVSSLPQA